MQAHFSGPHHQQKAPSSHSAFYFSNLRPDFTARVGVHEVGPLSIIPRQSIWSSDTMARATLHVGGRTKSTLGAESTAFILATSDDEREIGIENVARKDCCNLRQLIIMAIVNRKKSAAPRGIDPFADDARQTVPSRSDTTRRRKRAALPEQGKLRAPQHEPEVARSVVLKALEELVEIGLGIWLERADGALELHLLGGQRWLLEGDGMTRLA
jgi:hypothetical protein